MSRFMGEAEDFRLPGKPRRVLVTRDLIEELGVAGRPRGEQEVAVKAWLVTNEPHQVLALSLRADGFIDENVSNNLSNELRRTGTDDAGRTGGDTAVELHQHGRRRTRPDRRKPGSSGS